MFFESLEDIGRAAGGIDGDGDEFKIAGVILSVDIDKFPHLGEARAAGGGPDVDEAEAFGFGELGFGFVDGLQWFHGGGEGFPGFFVFLGGFPFP